MPIHPARTGIAAILAMGAAVTAFGVSTPPKEGGRPKFDVVVEQLVVPASRAGLQLMQTARPIAKGDTIESILADAGALDEQFLEFLQRNPDAKPLHKLVPGRTIHTIVDSIGRVHLVRVPLGINDTSRRSRTSKRLLVQRSEGVIKATTEEVKLIRSTRFAMAKIESSLFAATNRAKIPDIVANQVADVFGGDINFARDIRKGDQLRVIYETLAEPDDMNGRAVAGRLIAAQLDNRGKKYSAMWLERKNGSGQYYDFNGRSVSKSLLRYPIEYARISSGFARARMHPLQGKRKAHRGVDFAASRGTKIRSSGDGRITFVGTQRGYGRLVKVKHRGGYTTLYAHLQRFRKNMRRGTKVQQGDVIGYVGSSGWATGPHLHYEVHYKNRPRNPLTLKLPEARPLAAKLKVIHRARAAKLVAQFRQFDAPLLARNFE